MTCSPSTSSVFWWPTADGESCQFVSLSSFIVFQRTATLTLTRKGFYSYNNYDSRIRITKGNWLLFEKKDEINEIIAAYGINPEFTVVGTSAGLAAKCGEDDRQGVVCNCIFSLQQLCHASSCNVLLNGKGYHYALCSSSWHHLTSTKCHFPL